MKPVGRRSPIKAYASYALATISLSVLATPSALAFFFDYDLNPSEADYQACAAGLIEEGIAPDVAADACGVALRPEDLAACVANIDDAALTAPIILDACREVRRPDEMASCFNNIRGLDDPSEAGEVLENCRLSLLPERFANCVVGLQNAIDFSTTAAMESCIVAGDRPINPVPSFRPLP